MHRSCNLQKVAVELRAVAMLSFGEIDPPLHLIRGFSGIGVQICAAPIFYLQARQDNCSIAPLQLG